MEVAAAKVGRAFVCDEEVEAEEVAEHLYVPFFFSEYPTQHCMRHITRYRAGKRSLDRSWIAILSRHLLLRSQEAFQRFTYQGKISPKLIIIIIPYDDDDM